MVKLTRIYTRTGDAGDTGLGDGHRVSKADPRIEACGCVDEANAALGVAAVLAASDPPSRPIAALLASLQHDLFDAGADLCVPLLPAESPGSRLRISPAQTQRLERLIDEHNARLPTLTSFVLPGGTPLAAALHVARTAVRRAERAVVALRARDLDRTSPHVLVYLNRLSDLLFVLARVANHDGANDVLWVPGINRAP